MQQFAIAVGNGVVGGGHARVECHVERCYDDDQMALSLPLTTPADVPPREEESAGLLVSLVSLQNGNIRGIIRKPPRSLTQNKQFDWSSFIGKQSDWTD